MDMAGLTPLHTDYLVIGSGAMGMAFVDTLLPQSDAQVLMVDRHLGPGGHWNDAYPFVRLHQPSAIYGVNSRALGSDAQETRGFNAGLYERATAAELLSYYQRVMQDFLASGRVQYLPMCSYLGENAGLHRIHMQVSGQARNVQVRRKIVDSTYFNTAVPSTHPPSYRVDPGVRCIAPNDLPRTATGHHRYVVIGAGKTALDSCLWLLENGATPAAITWVMPRDAWHYNRAQVVQAEGFAQQWLAINADLRLDGSDEDQQRVMQCFLTAESLGLMLRMDQSVIPSMFHGATVSPAEWEALRRLPHVVRLGHVQHLTHSHMVLEHGTVACDAGQTLYIDCSASAVQRRPTVPVFHGSRITLQMLRWPMPMFSAALTAYLEAQGWDDAHSNALSTPLRMPDAPSDWLRLSQHNSSNMQAWLEQPALLQWMLQSRLSGLAMAAPTPTENV